MPVGDVVEQVVAAILVVGAMVVAERATIALLNRLPTNLRNYTIDLTELAKEGKLDEVVGRETQIEQVIEILGRRRKSNPCLIGEAGVGKTAIAEGLALKIAAKNVPKALQNKRVLALDLGLLIADTMYHGQFESRVKGVVKEVTRRKDVILFIDEIHTMVGLGRAEEKTLDAANMLKPALARGDLRCIGATTRAEYTQHIEKDQALERRFQPVVVPESTIPETILILKGLRQRYENYHHVCYNADALLAAATLSSRYITDRYLPDKAIDLLDQAGSRARRRNQGVVTEADMRRLISSRTGIPLEDVSADESARLLKFEEAIRRSVVGQDQAVEAISNAMRRARAGFKNPDRPSSFIFYGPTGVGKTELAKALALHYMGSKEAMLRLDMSEFRERYTVTKLIGAPPGYVGSEIKGVLSEPVRRRPHTVVLFDEIEKAHRDIDNLLLQILEDGRLTDAKGISVDFRNTIVILTSNVGSRAIVNGGVRSHEEMKKLAEEELRVCFRPELLNRLDEMIVFKQLTRGEVKQICDMMVEVVVERAKAAKKIKVEVGERLRERVVEEGFSPRYGARPIRRAITRLLEDNLAKKTLGGEIVEGDSVMVDVDALGKINLTIFKDKNNR